ncbi:MAG: SPOR domain-containing protein [Nitrospinae bacterium]|nr:SPOR domain-containing protein [Nitrospinota bacterium]
MKQFNLLKEVHGMRARLMGLNYQPERKFNKNNIYAVFLIAVAGFLLYEIYPVLEFGHPPSPSIPVIDKVKNDEGAFMPPKVETTTPHSEEVKDNPKNSPTPVENEDMIKSKEEVIKSGAVINTPAVPSPKVEEDSHPISPTAAKRERKEKKEAYRGVYIIRVATCVLKESADVVQRDLKGKGFSSYQKTAAGYIKGKIANLHKVYVGDYNSKKEVLLVIDKLKASGFSAIVEETPALPSPAGGEGKRKGVIKEDG